MPYKAQYLGGPYDGELTDVTTEFIQYLPPVISAYNYADESIPVIAPIRTGLYHLQRDDDGKFFYVHETHA